MTAASSVSSFGSVPTEAQLFIPHGDDECVEPEISIVIPALNEQITVGEFVDWCKEGLAKAGVSGEILIIDSSTDRTPEIALSHGARVLRIPKRGIGRAYIDALPYARGKFIVMGDCDLTYDFRELKDFVDRYHEGYEFVMGSRFTGSIEPGAMPPLHRYFGSPLTTWILNCIYGSQFTDIHSGMRGLTKSALEKMEIQSQSWEYASEMVLKAARLGLRIAEIPIHFFKDREGRLSHHKRVGFWSPWAAGWINLKVMLVYTPDSFLLKPGLAMFLVGAALCVSLSGGGYMIGRIGFDLHWMLLGFTLAVLGYGSVQIGVLARLSHGLRSGMEKSLSEALTYDRGMILAGVLTVPGVLLTGSLAWQYFSGGLKLLQISHTAIFGLFLIVIGFQTFGFTLLIEMMRRMSK